MDVMLIVEDPTMSVKCRTDIKALFLPDHLTSYTLAYRNMKHNNTHNTSE
jgi:hypothetical protein